MTRMGDQEIGVVSGRVGTYANGIVLGGKEGYAGLSASPRHQILRIDREGMIYEVILLDK